MTELKRRGDLAELAVACDIRRRGHGIAFPYGETRAYDLIVDRAGSLERVRVKHATSDGVIVVARCRTQTVVAGQVRAVHKYTETDIDWLAVYDSTTGTCFYVPAADLADGRAELTLRLAPTRNGQRRGIRFAADYLEF